MIASTWVQRNVWTSGVLMDHYDWCLCTSCAHSYPTPLHPSMKLHSLPNFFSGCPEGDPYVSTKSTTRWSPQVTFRSQPSISASSSTKSCLSSSVNICVTWICWFHLFPCPTHPWIHENPQKSWNTKGLEWNYLNQSLKRNQRPTSPFLPASRSSVLISSHLVVQAPIAHQKIIHPSLSDRVQRPALSIPPCFCL